MSLKRRADIRWKPIELHFGAGDRSSKQRNQAMAAPFARDPSEVAGVKSALLNDSGRTAERRKSSAARRPDSGTDVEQNRSGEGTSDEDETNTASSDENPPDNSPSVSLSLHRIDFFVVVFLLI